MPVKLKKRSYRAKRKPVDSVETMEMPALTSAATIEPKKSRFWKIALIVIVFSVIAALIARRYGNLFVVATVNGTPITRLALTQRLTDRFGSQMVEALIGEQLILAEAKKQNIVVPQADVQAKISEIEKNLGNSVTLEQSLKIQGLTREEFVNQIRLQLTVDKMLSREVSISATEVDEYIKSNQTQLRSTSDAQRRIEAENAVRSDKISEKFVDWFSKLKEQAKINRYL